MRLDSFLLADAATATQDGKLFIHGGGITRVSPPALPWTQPLAVVIRFEVDSGDFDRHHHVQVNMHSPEGEELLTPPPKLDVPPQDGPNVVEGEASFLQMAIGLLGIPLQTAGIYTVSVSVDGEPLRTLPLAVIAPPPTDRPPNRAER